MATLTVCFYCWNGQSSSECANIDKIVKTTIFFKFYYCVITSLVFVTRVVNSEMLKSMWSFQAEIDNIRMQWCARRCTLSSNGSFNIFFNHFSCWFVNRFIIFRHFPIFLIVLFKLRYIVMKYVNTIQDVTVINWKLRFIVICVIHPTDTNCKNAIFMNVNHIGISRSNFWSHLHSLQFLPLGFE